MAAEARVQESERVQMAPWRELTGRMDIARYAADQAVRVVGDVALS